MDMNTQGYGKGILETVKVILLLFLMIAPLPGLMASGKLSEDVFRYFHIQVKPEGVLLQWRLLDDFKEKQVILEKSQGKAGFETLKVFNGSDTGYMDVHAVFGKFKYRLRMDHEGKKYYSDIRLAETYLGKSFRQLHPFGGIEAGESLRIVFGHMLDDTIVTAVLYDTEANIIIHPVKYLLPDQLFEFPTDNLIPGEYVLAVKSQNWPMSIFKFLIK